MVSFQISYGKENNLPQVIKNGNMYFCTDTGNLFIDHSSERIHVNAKKAQMLTYFDTETNEYIDIDAETLIKLFNSNSNNGFIITFDMENMRASHNSTQIIEATQAGKIVMGQYATANGVINFKLDYAMTSADSTDTVLFTLPLEDGIIGIVVHKDYSIEETKATYSPINNIENASVGQLAMVKTIDTNGNVLSWTTIGLTVNGVVPDGNGNIDIPAAASDWNENDETQASYIHNRTHYEDENGVHPLDEKFIPDTVARVADIPNAIVSAEAAEVGQTIRVKNIDEDGKVEWEAVDFPETDLSAYYTKTEIDSLLNEYITEVDTIIG